MTEPNVTCILINWNGWRDTIECLDALRECTYKKLTTIVVDNGSTNDSIERIRAAHPEVLLLDSDTNLGFAGGNNIGIRYALAHGAEYVWLLNNDTKAAPDALCALMKKARSDRRIGAVASVCYYADRPAVVQAWAGARVNLWLGRARNSMSPQPDEWFHALYGASLLVSTQAIREAGLLDEGFFHYWEETEFCLRLVHAGWRLAAAGDSRVLHKVGSSNGDIGVLERYFTASGLRLLRLHSPARLFAMPVFVTTRFVRHLTRFQLKCCQSVWQGVQDYGRSRPIVQKIR